MAETEPLDINSRLMSPLKPHVIVMDAAMPGTSGLAVLKQGRWGYVSQHSAAPGRQRSPV